VKQFANRIWDYIFNVNALAKEAIFADGGGGTDFGVVGHFSTAS
jgi:hypothetical protein